MGQEVEQDKDISHAMRWIRINLRSWSDVSTLTLFVPFDVIVDKSTSDAICASEPQTFSPSSTDSSSCPTVREIVESDGEVELSPVETLAVHLVPLAQRGTTWVALSYSMFRFDNVQYIGRYRELVARTPLMAPSGEVSESAHAPEIFHWLYVLRRV